MELISINCELRGDITWGFSNTIYRMALFIPLVALLATAHVKADSLQLAENPLGSPTALPDKRKMKLISFIAPKASSGFAGR